MESVELIAMWTYSRSLDTALRIILTGICCLGIWCSLKLARADYLFHKDTAASVRSAIRLVPDGWQYYMRLAQFDQQHTRELLVTSLRLNPYNAEADIELALQDEAQRDFGRAEKEMLQAYNIDHTYLPRWSLANFYLRRGNMPAFWAWARSAADMPSNEMGSLFDLCWRVTPDADKISAKILSDKPEMIRQYLSFLLAKGQLQPAANVGQRLINSGKPEVDLPLLFSVVNRLVAANNAAAAVALWHSMIERRWIVADATAPNNANFAREPLPVSFDWSLPEYPGLHSWPGSFGLNTEFSGSEPQDCTIAEQAVVLAPGNYNFAYAYRTSGIASDTGIVWQIIDANSNAVLAKSSALSSADPRHSILAFSIPPGASLIRLRLRYRRTLGTLLVSGELDMLSTRIQSLPNS